MYKTLSLALLALAAVAQAAPGALDTREHGAANIEAVSDEPDLFRMETHGSRLYSARPN